MDSRLLWLLALVVISIPSALASQPDIILRVTKEIIWPDCTPRLSTVINGTSPGPLLTMEEGQHYWIRVSNAVLSQGLLHVVIHVESSNAVRSGVQ
jgi:hypothetical protein